MTKPGCPEILDEVGEALSPIESRKLLGIDQALAATGRD